MTKFTKEIKEILSDLLDVGQGGYGGELESSVSLLEELFKREMGKMEIKGPCNHFLGSGGICEDCLKFNRMFSERLSNLFERGRKDE